MRAKCILRLLKGPSLLWPTFHLRKPQIWNSSARSKAGYIEEPKCTPEKSPQLDDFEELTFDNVASAASTSSTSDSAHRAKLHQ